MADAVFSAGFLNACLRHADTVRMANMAPVVNTRGPLFVHPGGLVKRSTYHVLAMYANLLEPNVVNTWLASDTLTHLEKSIPVVDAVATCDGAMRKWSVVLVNRHPDTPVQCQVLLGGQPLPGAHQVTVLSGDSPEAYNDLDFPDRVIPYQAERIFEQGDVELSPHSVTVIQTL
jgi:alpha-N-arabinofuranosidase